jgi:hypothetical protein
MSLTISLTKAVDEVILTYINRLSNKYNISVDDLLTEWGGKLLVTTPKIENSSVSEPPSNVTGTHDELDPAYLIKCKNKELSAFCKQRGLKCSGTKAQLLSRLSGKVEVVESKQSTKKKSLKTKSDKVSDTPVAKLLTASVPTVAIRRNQFGNHEHPETSLVFDKKTKRAIGTQNDKGGINDLTTEDIDICNQYKFPFDLPDNLDKNTTLEDVEVEELGEVEEVDDDIDEEDLFEVEEEDELGDDEEYYEEEEEE